MPKRSSMPGSENSRLAKRLVDELTLEQPDKLEQGLSEDVRHLIAVALGRMGGLKGGKARAAKLSPKKRKAIAKHAAAARWGKRPSK
ncbi:MAG TPA: hypothetical protein VJU86_06200 [Pyrinomonadaceae bacterium]|nr:hypothetical protein [Pyrinomonadaceae bacterium]